MHGSIDGANAAAPIPGAVIAYLLYSWFGSGMTLPDSAWGAIELATVCLAAAWVTIFFVRFLLAPANLYAQQQKKIAELSSKVEELSDQLDEKDLDRIPILELLKATFEYDLRILEGNFLRFNKALSDAGYIGVLDFFGREDNMNAQWSSGVKALGPIPKEYWKDYKLDLHTVVDMDLINNSTGLVTDNSQIRTHCPGRPKQDERSDIWVRKKQALRWLKKEAQNIINTP